MMSFTSKTIFSAAVVLVTLSALTTPTAAQLIESATFLQHDTTDCSAAPVTTTVLSAAPSACITSTANPSQSARYFINGEFIGRIIYFDTGDCSGSSIPDTMFLDASVDGLCLVFAEGIFNITPCSGPSQTCGDGNLDTCEACDDGAGNSNTTPNACRLDCTAPSCGDGVADDFFGEECDDGAGNDDVTPDACRTSCTLPICGDGVLDSGEECEPVEANFRPIHGGCTECVTDVCGDGVLNNYSVDPTLVYTETCDDGNTVDGDGCDSTCQLEPGVPALPPTPCVRIQIYEDPNFGCDDMMSAAVIDEVSNGASSCIDLGSPEFGPQSLRFTSDSTTGVTQELWYSAGCSGPADETYVSTWAELSVQDAPLSATYTLVWRRCENLFSVYEFSVDSAGGVPYGSSRITYDACPMSCGDGVIDVGEECDDGYLVNSNTMPNACRSDCTNPVCGDGVTDDGEDCDDGNTEETDACLNDCTAASCGDGLVYAGVEECDNGIMNSDVTPDACRNDCTNPSCGDMIMDDGEECDDGELNSDTEINACRLTCVEAGCGDGVIDAGEGCDDGNTVAGDGCDETCFEAGSLTAPSLMLVIAAIAASALLL